VHLVGFYCKDIFQYYGTDDNDRVTKKKYRQKTGLMLSKIILKQPINTGRTGAVMLQVIVGHHGVGIEYHNQQESTLARSQTIRIRFVEQKDSTDFNTLTSITATINTGRVGSPAPSLSAQFSRVTLLPFYTNFPSDANLKLRMKNGRTSVLLSPCVRRNNPVSPSST
jgi:hypothetical protein